jgi:hypothetical protein
MAVALQAAGDPTHLYQLVFVVMPLAVNIMSAAFLSGAVYFWRRRRTRSAVPDACPTITLPATLSVLIACFVPIGLVNALKVLGGGLDTEWLGFVLFANAMLYVLVSDFLHYVVFHFIAPAIWGRDHIQETPCAKVRTSEAVASQGTLRRGAPHDEDRPGLQRSGTDTAAPTVSFNSGSGLADQRCLSIWISGYRSSLMSNRELLAITFSRTVLALSFFIGTAAGLASAIILRAFGDETYYVLFLLSFAPLVVNVLSALVASAMLYLRTRRAFRNGSPIPLVVVPSFLTVAVTTVPVLAVIYGLKVTFGGLGAESMMIVLIGVSVGYVIIADFFHYIVFRYIAPSIWRRPHLYLSQMAPAQSELESDLTGPEHTQPAFAGPSLVEIGNATVDLHSILMLEAQGNYLRIVTRDQEFLERFKISAAVDMLSDAVGVFLHRSYWVAFAGIDRVESVGAQYRVLMRNGEALTIASTRRQAVLDAFALNGVHVVLSANTVAARS